MLKLVKLEKKYQSQLIDMMEEWEKTGEKIIPYAIRKTDYHNFDVYLNSLEVKDDKEGLVPDSTFFCLDTDRNIFIGAVNIRHYLNEALLLNGGHIGDGVRPSERRKGYATEMIKLALEECRKLGIDKVLMMCDKENIGSARSTQKNGGILENEVVVDGIIEQRYWIDIIDKTSNKNVFLIHGYNGIPKIYEWLESKLKKMGYNVITPKFEPREGVIYESWKKTFDNYRKYIDDESIIVAHSIGNEFIIKYFNENNLSAKLYISLAGFSEYFEWQDKEDLNRACKEFLVNKEELENFRDRCSKKYSIYSNNDHIVPFEILQAYPKTIEATPVLIENIGHMGKKSGLEEIPKVIELIEENEKI